MNSDTIIGMDAKRIVRNTTGLGNYCRTLVNDLAARAEGFHYNLYAPDPGRDDLRRHITERPAVSWHYSGRRLPLGRSLWRIGAGIVGQMRRDGVALFHGLSGELPRGLRQSGIRGVVTIHDLIFLRHPEWYPWLDAQIYAWKFRYTCREADHIIAISECTRRDVIELGGVPEEKVSVVYQSCNPRFIQRLTDGQLSHVRQRYRLPERFVLSVGTIERRKNLALAIRALQQLPEDIHLVAVGRQTDYARELPASARVHLVGGVFDDELAALYQMAEAFVYPSRYEGFGIPVIEAIHSGLPVVACTGSCLEEAGGPDSLYVSPDDPEGGSERIRRSRQYVSRFAGSDVAGQVAALYRRLL